MLKIRPKKRKQKRGFDPNVKTKDRQRWRHVAIELNQETWEVIDGFPDMHNSEILDVLEIHHITIAPVNSKADQALIKQWSELIADCYISPTEFLAEIYTTTINDHALSINANIGRIYHNSYLGDTRLRPNSIGHIFEAGDHGCFPDPVLQMLKKYVFVEHIADGNNITLKNRLGL